MEKLNTYDRVDAHMCNKCGMYAVMYGLCVYSSLATAEPALTSKIHLLMQEFDVL